MEELKNKWFKLLENVQVDEEVLADFWVKISNAYSGKGRYYHTLKHIAQLLNLSERYSSKILDINNLQLSIFYHDVVYSVTKNNNEEKSADFAEVHLKKLNFSAKKITKCRNYIIATKNHLNLENDPDLDFFLDFDLEKLGCSWPEYEEYTQQIRKEYRIYPKLVYNKGRKKVLAHFLAQNSIYKTKEFIKFYENTARENLKRELLILSK